MKVGITLFFVLICCAMLHAQQGSVLVYGNVDLSNQEYAGNHVRQFSINPGVGYQFSDHMTAGLELTYLYFKNDLNPVTSKTTRISTGPFFRYSMPINDWFSAYLQAGTGYASEESIVQENGFYAYIFPALFLHVKNGFGLNFSTGKVSFSKIGEVSSFDFNYGLIPTIGVSKNFGRAAKE